MSQALYPTRLYWVGWSGFARLLGVEIKLDRAPQLPGVQVDQIDYVPGGVCQVMPKGERWRDMDRRERHDALVLLRHLHGRSR